jgi:hypothetical protein
MSGYSRALGFDDSIGPQPRNFVTAGPHEGAKTGPQMENKNLWPNPD